MMLRSLILPAILLVTVTVQGCSGGSPRSLPSRAADAPTNQDAAEPADHSARGDAARSAPAQTVTVTGMPEDCEPLPPDPNAVVPPSVISRKDPVIPKDVEVHGMVVLDVVLSRSGQIVDASVRRSFTPEFDKACIDAVRQWRFRPATQKGIPVSFEFSMRCEFNPQAQPAVVPPDDPKFQEILEFTEWVSDQHPHKFRVEGNEVVVDTSA